MSLSEIMKEYVELKIEHAFEVHRCQEELRRGGYAVVETSRIAELEKLMDTAHISPQ